MLLLINGAPGVGKSTLARLYADEHGLSLIVDIDDLRRHLGRWTELGESKLIARDLAVTLAHAHLQRGNDVIVPQFLAQPVFRERLRALAEEVGVPFVELLLTADADAVVERFAARRREFAGSGAAHPEAELSDDSIATEIPAAIDHLRRDALSRGIPMISSQHGLVAAYEGLLHCLASQS